MKSRANLALQPAMGKTWLDRVVDFLFGPSPHQIYFAGAAADAKKRNDVRTPRERGSEAQTASVALAVGGFGSYCVADPSQKDNHGRC